MRAAILSITLCLACAHFNNTIGQHTSPDVVYLKNGGFLKGTVVQLIPDDVVKIELADGSLMVFEMTDVDRIERNAMPQVRRSHNSYRSHKAIAGWGLTSSWGATLLGSLAMNDDYMATTIIPVVGPVVTIARIENDPFAYYRPGGKPLLIASTAIQSAFLLYYVTSWSKSRSYQRRVALAAAPNSIMFTMRF